MNRLRLPTLLGLLLLVYATPPVCAQFTQFGNQFVRLWMVTDPPDGSFYIKSGPAVGDVRYLFGNYGFITSNVVFRIDNDFGTFYYSNHRTNFPFPPRLGGFGDAVPFRSYDSLRVTPDTLELYYLNIGGVDIIERWVVEKPQTIYDSGSDLLLEFEPRVRPGGTGAKVGVFLMLDAFNSDAAGVGGTGDKSSILTSSGYFGVGSIGGIFTSKSTRFDSIPTFYHVGNFTTERPVNNIFSVHRLKGMSHGGASLTPPNSFAIGDWRNRFREVSWEVYSSDLPTSMSDCATALRWENIPLGKVVRTAFGTNDKEGNNLFHCRDSLLFVDIKTERVVEQKELNGTYTPQSFDVEMWITSVSLFDNQDLQISIEQPITSDRGPNRLTLDASTPVTQRVFLGPSQTKILRWRLNFNPLYSDDSANVTPMFRYRRTIGTARRFLSLCNPTITIKKFGKPAPPVDTVAPQIVAELPTRGATVSFPFRTFDRHPGYRYDTGLDRIVVERNDNGNFALNAPLAAQNRCDTTYTTRLVAQVVDTTQSGYIVFAVYDCRGNVSRDSAIYNPRPDIFAPELLRIDSAGSAGPPCNTRQWTLWFIDSLNQFPHAGDNGLGSISFVGVPVNIGQLAINAERGSVPIAAFDARASVQLAVLDTMYDAWAAVSVADYAGNADTIALAYCTLPDTAAPRSRVTPTTGRSWMVEASDTLSWDRGLSSVVVLANPGNNMTVSLPAVTLGDRSAQWGVSVVNDASDAEVTMEVRDVVYSTQPEGHADTITIRFPAVPDTLAPVILFQPEPGSNRARATVIVSDTHTVNGAWYRYDVGLGAILLASISPNVRIVAPPVFSVGDSTTSFRIEIVDTLVLNRLDSICVDAVDIAGNRSVNCYYYPITPDRLSPQFAGVLDLGAAEIRASGTDLRPYDRGMGSIRYNPVLNSGAPLTVFATDGSRQLNVRIPVPDPTRAVAGEFVVADAIGAQGLDSSTEGIHTVRLPFHQPAVHLRMTLPGVVEPGEEFDAAILATDTIDGRLVDSIRFAGVLNGSAAFVGGSPRSAGIAVLHSGGRVGVVLSTNSGRALMPGDTLALLRFRAIGAASIGQMLWGLDPATIDANGNRPQIVVGPPRAGDTAVPRLELPPVYVKIVSDSLTYINGECERVLSTTGRSSKLALLGIAPQPLNTATGSAFQIDMVGLPATGGVLELIDANGLKLAQTAVAAGSLGTLRREILQVPADLAPGAYIVRLRVEGGAVWLRAAVVR